MTKQLTRENRYEPAGQLLTGPPGALALQLAGPGVVSCRSCGSLVLAGREDDHEPQHQVAPVMVAFERRPTAFFDERDIAAIDATDSGQ